MQPTVFADVTPEMTIAREEIFGPVLAAIDFADVDEAIARANDSMYGLAAGVWTRDIKKAHYVASKLKAGTVWVNTYNVYDTAAPFGGYKQSGFGREMGQHALDYYTQLKTVWVDLGRHAGRSGTAHSAYARLPPMDPFSPGALNFRSSTPARTSSVIRSARCRRGRATYLQAVRR